MHIYPQQNKSIFNPGLVILFTVAAGLSGCGGGGGGGGGGNLTGLSYSGTTTQATVDSSSAKPLAETSAEASIQAVSDNEGGAVNPIGVVVTDSTSSDMKAMVSKVGKQLSKNSKMLESPTGATVSFNDLLGPGSSCGGTITIPDNQNATSGTVTFNNACMTDYYGTYTFNGSMTFAGQGDPEGYSAGSITTRFFNLTVSYDLGLYGGTGVYGPMNYTETCSWEDGGSYYHETCSTTNYYTSSGGEVFQIKDADVSGSDTYGWNVTATVYHPTYGYVNVSATGLTFDCTNGHPDAGHIGVTGSGGTSLSVDFTDCDTYSGSYNDGSGAAVSISGW